jgi:hypothetical protein
MRGLRGLGSDASRIVSAWMKFVSVVIHDNLIEGA